VANIYSLLLDFYEQAVAPPEAPGKADHGDIDILVDKQLNEFAPQKLKEKLSAEKSYHAGGTSSFAILLSGKSDSYLQLDVHLCRKGCFGWEVMINSYGDLWHILGAAVTRFRLEINHAGFYLRVAEIQATHKKDCLLLLTRDPRAMMEFLGLSTSHYEIGFRTLDQVFEWATSSRLFRKRFFDKEVLRNKEQKVRAKRPMYAKFVADWLPYRPAPKQEDSKEDDKVLETVLVQGALDTFGKRDEYERTMENHRCLVLRDAIWKGIVNGLPMEGKDLGEVMVMLKRGLYWDGSAPSFLDASGEPVRTLKTIDESVVNVIVAWTLEHWMEVPKVHKIGAV